MLKRIVALVGMSTVFPAVGLAQSSVATDITKADIEAEAEAELEAEEAPKRHHHEEEER